MISKNSEKILRWMLRNDKWLYSSEIKSSYFECDYRVIRTLVDEELIDQAVFEGEIPYLNEYGEETYDSHYRINDAGRAYIESRNSNRWKELRAWLTAIISVAAFVKSFFF